MIVDSILDTAKQSLKEKTPEDTWELVDNWEKQPIRREGGKIVGEITNATPYGKYVEYWVQGKEYWYHKPKGKLFYIWVGAGMVRRTYAEVMNWAREKVKEGFRKIIKSVNLWTK
jgi:hypothetical protein